MFLPVARQQTTLEGMSSDSFEGDLFSKGCVNPKPMGLLLWLSL